jgi:flagellin
MARINTNIGAITAQRYLARNTQDMNTTIQRLSSGLRITRGADDPAGLICSERLRSEISAVGQAIANTRRASNIIATTEGALDEVARLLVDIQDLIVESANEGALSEEEIKANQLQVDSAINSITRIANSTSFAGRQLLNGSLEYVTSGVATSSVVSLDVQSVMFGTRSYIPVNIEVTTSAQPAILQFPLSTVASSVTFELQGNTGATMLTFTSGTTASAMIAAINTVADATGVTASAAASGFVMYSQHLGSRQFVEVTLLPGSGDFDLVNESGVSAERDIGRDAVAQVNGALCYADGNDFTLRTGALDMDFQLHDLFATGTTQFAITGGGSLFQVGPEVNSNLQVSLGVQSVAASRLGNADLGYLTQVQSGGGFALVDGEYQRAQQIITEAIQQVSVLRGRLGAFEKNTLDTNVNSLSITMENLMASESAIRDADFAHETSELSRTQILVNAGTSVLALAQQSTKSVLALLS